jgi:hypothetical protein
MLPGAKRGPRRGVTGNASRLGGLALSLAREIGVPVTEQIVTYRVDESTVVGFEIEPTAAFHPAGAGEVAGWVQNAVGPAVDAAKAVLAKAKESQPDHVEVKFGVKVSGSANWFIAKAATEGNFQITLSWDPGGRDSDAAEKPEAED